MLPEEKAQQIYGKVYGELYALTELRPRVAKRISLLIVECMADTPELQAAKDFGFDVSEYHKRMRNFIVSDFDYMPKIADDLVKDSQLHIRIKNVIEKMCLTNDSALDGLSYGELRLSHLTKLRQRDWLRRRGIANKGFGELKKYLQQRGIEIEY